QQNVGNASTSTAKIAVQIPAFRGEPKENVVAWLLQVLTIFRAQGITNESMQVNYATTGLKDAALHWYLNKVVGNNNVPPYNTWMEFANAMKVAFQPPNYQQYLRQQLKKLRRINTVQEYTSQFQNVVGQIENMEELDQVTYYIDGLKPATKMEVAYRAPDTLEQAISHAIRYDTAMFGTGKPASNNRHTKQFKAPRNNNHYDNHNNNHNHNNHNNHDNSNNNNNGKFVPMELDRFETPRKPQRGNCFKCGNPGHYARNCRSKPRPNLTNLEDIQQQQQHQHQHQQQQPPVNNGLELSQVEENRERLLRFNGKINGHNAWILLDSGASRNFIDKEFVNRNCLTTKTVSPISVELADGRKTKTDKIVGINKLELGSYHTTGISAQVIKLQRYDVILGKPWLYHANPIINWRTNNLTF